MRRYFSILPVVLSLALMTTSLPVFAQTGLFCALTNQPAATVLLPYFEVDLANVDGPNTFFSVGNRSEEATLAHAVVWTNWGHPVLSFDFFMSPGGLQTFNLRSLLQGQVPETSPPMALPEGRFESCSIPAQLPNVDPAKLQALLTGQADPDTGLCYASAAAGNQLATGYITVDSVHDCSGAGLVTPNDENYFIDKGRGLATNDNVLWGDFFLVDESEDFAQGERLVSIIADRHRFGRIVSTWVNPAPCTPFCPLRNKNSFYHLDSNRMPIARSYEARFLKGGGFDGGTDLLVWSQGSLGPVDCSTGLDEEGTFEITAEFRNEAGQTMGSEVMLDPARTFRVKVGSAEMPVSANFGSVELNAKDVATQHPQQIWTMTLLSGLGRFSVGAGAVPTGDFCSEEFHQMFD